MCLPNELRKFSKTGPAAGGGSGSAFFKKTA
jgi:hypothetical protein